MIGFLGALGLERVTLIGHSLGAVAALLAAEASPERVERLIIEEPAPPVRAEPPLEAPEAPEGPQAFDRRATAAVVAECDAPDPAWWSGLAKIAAPTLVIGGGPTSHIPQSHLADLVDRIPDARLVTIDGAGHLVHEERPLEFLAAVNTFLTPHA